jgi:hypothetical protein
LFYFLSFLPPLFICDPCLLVLFSFVWRKCKLKALTCIFNNVLYFLYKIISTFVFWIEAYFCSVQITVFPVPAFSNSPRHNLLTASSTLTQKSLRLRFVIDWLIDAGLGRLTEDPKRSYLLTSRLYNPPPSAPLYQVNNQGWRMEKIILNYMSSPVYSLINKPACSHKMQQFNIANNISLQNIVVFLYMCWLY